MKRLLTIVLIALAVAVTLLWRPVGTGRFPSHPHPATDYAEALQRVAAVEALDGPEISPECRSRLLTHGARTARAVVLIHGLTNCPEQFRALGERLYGRGANVYIPRLPEHGLADRMTSAHARLDARTMCLATDQAVDISRGLGDSVIVVGLCIGGSMAAWAAQERADVVRAVAIAPLQGLARARGPLTLPAMNLMLALPNQFIWWDGKVKTNLPGPKHVYPRFSTRSVAQTLLLGAAVEADARRAPPAAGSIVVITVGSDVAVDNGAVARLVSLWRTHGARVTAREFPARLRLNHDVIDPEQVGGNPVLVYPVLEALIAPWARGAPAAAAPLERPAPAPR
jgi:alpha-beta hydrolase superfamily lysophospholipase